MLVHGGVRELVSSVSDLERRGAPNSNLRLQRSHSFHWVRAIQTGRQEDNRSPRTCELEAFLPEDGEIRTPGGESFILPDWDGSKSQTLVRLTAPVSMGVSSWSTNNGQRILDNPKDVFLKGLFPDLLFT